MNISTWITKNSIMACFFEPFNVTYSVLPIRGNGVIERGETCNCYHFDRECNHKCSKTPSVTQEEQVSLIAVIAVPPLLTIDTDEGSLK